MKFAQLSSPLKPDKILVFSAHGLKPDHVESACVAIEKQFPLTHLELLAVNGGESLKGLEGVGLIWKSMIEEEASRSTLIVAIGGGALTDAIGFAASTFKRGLPWVAVPTTLLGMVDAAWGGKTGINWGDLKNIVGTFHPPLSVWIESEWLETLPDLEIWNGWMEMVKHGLIHDPQAWADLAQFHPLEVKKPELFRMAKVSATIKNQIVTADPFERGQRKLLNLGHTTGHAIEASSQEGNNPQPIPHGISVGWGMRFSIRWSLSKLNRADPDLEKADSKLNEWLEAAGYGDKPQFRTDVLWEKILQDKKNSDGKVLEVMLEGIGKAKWDVPLERREFVRIWDRLH